MNKFRFIIFVIALAALLPSSKGFLATKSDNVEITGSIAPMQGRKGEVDFYNLLTNAERTYKSWIRDGNAYLRRTEYEQAIWAYRKAVRLRPAAEEARFLLAVAYEKRLMEGLPGDITNWELLAEKEYKAAIEVADHLPSRFNLAMLQRRQKRYEEARKNLEHILLVKTGNKDKLAIRAEKLLEELFDQDVRPDALSTIVSRNPEDTCSE